MQLEAHSPSSSFRIMTMALSLVIITGPPLGSEIITLKNSSPSRMVSGRRSIDTEVWVAPGSRVTVVVSAV